MVFLSQVLDNNLIANLFHPQHCTTSQCISVYNSFIVQSQKWFISSVLSYKQKNLVINQYIITMISFFFTNVQSGMFMYHNWKLYTHYYKIITYVASHRHILLHKIDWNKKNLIVQHSWRERRHSLFPFFFLSENRCRWWCPPPPRPDGFPFALRFSHTGIGGSISPGRPPLSGTLPINTWWDQRQIKNHQLQASWFRITDMFYNCLQ